MEEEEELLLGAVWGVFLEYVSPPSSPLITSRKIALSSSQREVSPSKFSSTSTTSSKFFSCECGYDGQFAHHKHYTKFFKKGVLQSSGIEGIGVDLVREQFFCRRFHFATTMNL